MASAHALVLGSLAVAGMLGCSATAGSSWVSQPEPGPFANDDLSLPASEHLTALSDEPHASEWAPTVPLDEENRPRRRLDRTVTLGEVYAEYTERPAQSPPAGPAPV